MISQISVSSVPSVALPFRAFRVFRGSPIKNVFLKGCQRAGVLDATASTEDMT